MFSKIIKYLKYGTKFGYKLGRWYQIFGYSSIFNTRSLIKVYFFPVKVGKDKYIPKQLFFDPINICNAKCVFCNYRNILKKSIKIMPLDIFKSAIDQYVFLGGKHISLTPTVGELLLDITRSDKIAYAKSKGLTVHFFTNSILFNSQENYKKIVDSNIDYLDISLGDLDPKEESQIYGIPLEIAENVPIGLKKLLIYNNEKLGIGKIRLHFRTKRPPYKLYWDKKFLYIRKNIRNFKLSYLFLQAYDNRGGNIREQDLLGIMKLKKPISRRNAPCKRLYNFSILTNGDVRLCGCRALESVYDDLIIGNIKENNLKNIFQDYKIESIRKKFSNNNCPKVCENCTLYEPLLSKKDKEGFYII